MSDPKHGLTHSELGELDPDFTEEPNRRTDPWVGPALSELYGTVGDDGADDDLGPRPASWGELMELLDECWPAEFFPTLEDDPTRDAGARIVSLLRWVDMLRAQPPTWRMSTALGIPVTYAEEASHAIAGARPAVGETATQFLARLFELSKRAPITYGVPDSSEFGAMAAIKNFVARSRFRK